MEYANAGSLDERIWSKPQQVLSEAEIWSCKLSSSLSFL